MPSRSKR
ncbi:hypothetical protein GMOD_00008349 [Pyrenophora seminiperda CCB06]|nr:hypothetical protein GMOD_00008349 [Pyrenophora seminiperda CCB06]